MKTLKAPSLAVCLLLLLAAPLAAGFKTTVTGIDDWRDGVETVAIVVTECAEQVGCAELVQEAQQRLVAMEPGFAVVPERSVREFLFSQGHTAYAPELRELLAEEFGLDAILELKVPFAKKGSGWGGNEKSQVTVEMTLVRPTGAILLHGVGNGRPLNVVSSPERVAGNVVEKLFEEAFR